MVRRLIRLYPREHYERFGEGMEQAFGDLLRERGEEGKSVFAFALWMFAETSAGIMRENITTLFMKHRNIIRIALATAFLLLIPLVAMRFTDEVAWTLFDFIFAGALLFGTGLAYELVARRSAHAAYRLAVGIAVVATLLLIWINGAVGFIGDEDNAVNLMYGGVLLIGIVGAAIARLQPQGMARVLLAMAAAQMLVPVIALVVATPVVTAEPPGIVGVFGLNAFFAMLFAGSAILFRRANDAANAGARV